MTVHCDAPWEERKRLITHSNQIAKQCPSSFYNHKRNPKGSTMAKFTVWVAVRACHLRWWKRPGATHTAIWKLKRFNCLKKILLLKTCLDPECSYINMIMAVNNLKINKKVEHLNVFAEWSMATLTEN